MSRLVLAAAALLLVAAASPRVVRYADPEEALPTLPAGEGRDVVEANCIACHSYDYVTTQPPHMGDAFWHAEVTKMVEKYGAPIEPADRKVIGDYLARTYR